MILIPNDIIKLIMTFVKKCDDCKVVLIEPYSYYLSVENKKICLKCRFFYRSCQMCNKLYKESIYCKVCDKVCKSLCYKCVINFFYNKI